MKKLMFVLALVLVSTVAVADTPVVDARQENQDERIDQSERARLMRSEDRASRNIAKQKHDRQDHD